MQLRRLARALALATALAVAGIVQVAVAPEPSSAAVFDALHRIHDEQVNGDFTISGNAVLACPTAPGTPRTECLGASRRENGFNNNRFAMTYADVDSDPTTYNSSSASVTLPAGARATYARLQWGGNRDGQQCGVGAAGSYPPGSAATQRVRLTVGGAATRNVSPAGYTADTTSIGYYSADADVSDAFADLPDGRPVTITVGNVYAPTGVGCWGGWSVTVIYDTPDAGCAVQRREVFVFDGHVRQGASDPPLDATAVGLRVAGTPAHFGVTAFEGDSGQTGDQLLLNGTNIPEPNTGALANFFNSTADHQIDPDYPNNFSIDATSLTVPPGVINPGVTSVSLRVVTSGDAFLLKGLALSVPIPSLCIEKSVSPATAHPGDPLTWTIRVSNPSTANASDVAVADTEIPACARSIGALAAGQSRTFTCTSVAPGGDLTNTATVTGVGGGGGALTDSASATVDVLNPAVAITKTASADIVEAGDPVTWTIRVENTGDAVLDPVTVGDDLVGACDRAGLGPLAAGGVTTYECTGAVDADTTNTATVTGADVLGRTVTDTDRAKVEVTQPAARVDITTTPRVPETGARFAISIDIANTGNVALEGGTVEVTGAPGCDDDGLSVAPGESIEVACTISIEDSVTLAATAELQPVLDGRTVGRPLLVRTSLVVEVAPSAEPPGGGTPSSLPDTGLAGSLVPLGALGLLLLGGGTWLVRRSRI